MIEVARQTYPDRDTLMRDLAGLVADQLRAAHATKDRATLTALSNKHGMGLSAISEVADVLASDHLAARGLWEETEVEGRTVRIPGPLFREVGP